MSTDLDALPALPVREPLGHKGTFGTVAVVGGSAARPNEDGVGGVQMVGGPSLAALAALRVGAGLVRLVLPEPLVPAGLTIAPSATGVALTVDHAGDIVAHLAAAVIDELIESAQCLAVGPGLGRTDGARAVVLRAIVQPTTPLVLDADAINALTDMPEIHRDLRAPTIFTPHIGEARRLGAALGVAPSVDDPEARALVAEQLAQKLGGVVVLKSAVTVVSDGQRTWTHDHPNSALATAGTGDVLTGVIAGLVAQTYRPHLGAGERTLPSERRGGLSLYDGARLGVRAHALAAQRWTRRTHASAGLLASDLLDELPAAAESLRGA